jgi:hypothetical protein
LSNRKKERWIVIALLLSVLWIVHLLLAPLAYFAVRAACSAEGGLRVVEYPTAEGYWHAGSEWSEGLLETDCWLCAEQVIDRRFAHVDVEKPGPLAADESGFVQYRLEPASHPNCVSGASSKKPPDGMCVAIVPLQSSPNDRYKYRNEILTTRSWFGVPLRELRHSLEDITTKRVVAIEKYFSYSTFFERRGKFAPSYHCAKDSRFESRFFSAVFRDKYVETK